MPYREKTAWLALIALAFAFGSYFTFVAASAPGGGPAEPTPTWAVCRGRAWAAALVGLAPFYLRRRAPQEARTPPDERDRAIMRRSLSSAYYVLLAGMILVGCVLPFNSRGWTIINAAVAMIVAAEVVRNGAVVVSYRRQA